MKDSAERWAVNARNVSFTYPGGVVALRDVNFRVREGEFVAVLGANGSGKTTLLKALMQLVEPQAGRVFVGEDDAARLRPADLYRRIGMVFQNPTDQLFAPTVEQDVAFGPSNLGMPDDVVEARIEEAMEAVGVLGIRQRPIHQLSFGQQKRACLAGVLAMRPPILLLDEPTAGLDPVAEQQMIELLLRLNRRDGTTVIICTHAVDLLPVLADRVCVLREGSVWREGAPAEVLGDQHAAAGAGLRLPLVAQLFYDLAGARGLPVARLPLTIAEARQQILELLAQSAGSAPTAGAKGAAP